MIKWLYLSEISKQSSRGLASVPLISVPHTGTWEEQGKLKMETRLLSTKEQNMGFWKYPRLPALQTTEELVLKRTSRMLWFLKFTCHLGDPGTNTGLCQWRHWSKEEWDRGMEWEKAVRTPATFESSLLGYLSAIMHNSSKKQKIVSGGQWMLPVSPALCFQRSLQQGVRPLISISMDLKKEWPL